MLIRGIKSLAFAVWLGVLFELEDFFPFVVDLSDTLDLTHVRLPHTEEVEGAKAVEASPI